MSRTTAIRVFELVTGVVICGLLAWLLVIYGLPGKVEANAGDIEEGARRQAIAERNILELDFQQRWLLQGSAHANLKLDAIMGRLTIKPVTEPELPGSKLTNPNAPPR